MGVLKLSVQFVFCDKVTLAGMSVGNFFYQSSYKW